jgi:acyl transferase domain-containing protein
MEENLEQQVDFAARLKQSLSAMQKMRAKIQALEYQKTEPIAIIGMGCRFPGGANTPDAFWQLLCNQVDAAVEIPADRWPIDEFYDPDPDAPGKMNTRWGAFLEDIAHFDAEFFGIPPREAVSLDPQHRLWLEVCWEALEDANQAPDQLSESQVGVFAGITTGDYFRWLVADPAEIDAYIATGNAPSTAVGRLSYLLGIHGPSVAIDTACSSSLLAVHLACQSLRSGESELAVAGGVNLILAPELMINFSKAHMLAPDGRCKTFDAAANGYVRGEGCGVVVLKRLSDAQSDGDHILAVIRSSAVNQDGRSAGLTAPSGPAQEAVIRAALEKAAIAPEQVSYIEAHGTGTPLGDPIEVRALGAVFGEGRQKSDPLWIGSVKTNIGHLEMAAGIAGLIKTVLCLRHAEIPAVLHFQNPNPYIPWELLPIQVPTRLTPWKVAQGQRIAGVSSFGFSGTNVHLLVEEAAPPTPTLAPPAERPVQLFNLSARNEKALRDLAGQYAEHLTIHPEQSFANICHTLGTGRSHFNHRLASATADAPSLAQQLAAFATGEMPPELKYGEVGTEHHPKIAFLFTGQGSQHIQMGQQLYDSCASFRWTLDQCDKILRAYLEHPLLDVILNRNGAGVLLDQTGYTQPALFALEYALAELWRSWGVEPTIVMGHSLGEYVAACTAEVFSLEDGLKLVARRAQWMQALPTGGAMAAVFASEARVRQAIAPYLHNLDIAAVNAPEEVTISGAARELEAVLAQLEVSGIRSRRLRVSHAFHSPLIEPMLDEFERAANEITYRQPLVGVISNITGKLIYGEGAFSARYWRQHARQGVRFAASIATLHDQGCDAILEVGPKPVLIDLGQSSWPQNGRSAVWLASLRAGGGDWEQMLDNLSSLYTLGETVNWSGLDHDFARQRVPLPKYPFQRQRYWLKAGLSSRQAAIPQARSSAKLLDEACYEVRWKTCSANTPETQPHSWLILADTQGIGLALADSVRRDGDVCVLAEAGTAFEQIAPDRFRLRPDCPDDFQRLLAQVMPPERPAAWKMIHLWNLDTSLAAQFSLGELEKAGALSAKSLAFLLQAVSQVAAEPMPQIWVVTRGAQSVAGMGVAAIAQSLTWGLGRTAALEMPEIWAGMIDLDPGCCDPQSDAQWLRVAFGGGLGDEDQLAVRQNGWYAPRLERWNKPTNLTPVHLRPDGAYWITGGLGGLGLRLARGLARLGAQRLVLQSRRGLPDRSLWPELPRSDPFWNAVQEVLALEKTGCQVEIVAADVSDPLRMAAIKTTLNERGWLLRGVFHAAGVAEPCLLQTLDSTLLDATLQAKVSGSWVLHELTRDDALDWFVLFSSGSAVWGSQNLAHYAAANAFLDALAHYRHCQGLPALSINWGPWGGNSGMVKGADQAMLSQIGMETLPPEAALRALEGLMSSGATQVTVALADWPKFSAIYAARRRRPFLDRLAASTQKAVSAAAHSSNLSNQLAQSASGERRRLLTEHVQALVASVMGFDSGQSLALQQGFAEAGMNSLMAVELRNHLQSSLGLALPASVAFNYPNIGALAEFLDTQIPTIAATVTASAKPAADKVDARPTPNTDTGEIAVVGIGCRFPGNVDSPESYWKLLCDGIDAVSIIPPDRWDIEAYYDPTPGVPGKMYTRWGSFLNHVDHFDANFFGISPREASSMDPQQRILLEVMWEALERAGQSPHQLAGTRTGVFVGISNSDYATLQLRNGSATGPDTYFATGTALSVAVGRLAYTLGLHGPALAVDTACSSALMATHLACQSLRAGESRIALAGGVNLLLSPESTVMACGLRMLSPEGHCKTFDAAADGYVRGEGCGIIVLKRLSDAQADGDHILAVIRGSAVNHDGRTSGLTVPNGLAQQALLRAALETAHVTSEQIGYIEAHGTGTALGDPIEVESLAAIHAEAHSPQQPLVLGAAKSNIGHLEAAAGIAGLIKAILCVEHGQIPPNLHFHQLNPHIVLPNSFHLPTQITPWPEGYERRMAGVSSFGFSGTNVHVILQDAPTVPAAFSETNSHPPSILSLSAKNDAALIQLADRYAQYLVAETNPSVTPPLTDITFTANTGRAHFDRRAAVVAASASELQEKLAAFTHQHEASGVYPGGMEGQPRPKIAFLFTGQGAQYTGMGHELYQTQPVFKEAVDTCACLLEDLLDFPLQKLLFEPEKSELLDQTQYTQPALFALEYALAELWQSWGVEPDVLMGHSVGEYVAACRAGVFSLADGLKLITTRGEMMMALPGGAMAAVFAPEQQVIAAIAAYKEQVSIAAVNASDEIVISGIPEVIDALLAQFKNDGVKARRLRVSHAFHSPMMEPMLDAFETAAGRVEYHLPKMALLSNISGSQAEQTITQARYWREHVRAAVRFADSIKTIHAEGCNVLLEIGPQPVLTGLGQRSWAVESPPALWLASLKSGRSDLAQISGSLAALYARGVEIDWKGVNASAPRQRVPLPTYPFQRKRYWFQQNPASSSRPTTPALHRVRSPLIQETLFELPIHPHSPAYLDDHRLYGTVVVPASSYIAKALSAVTEYLGNETCVLEELLFHRVLVLADDETRTLQVVLKPTGANQYDLEVISLAEQEGPGLDGKESWVRHATAKVRLGQALPKDGFEPLSMVQGRCRPAASSDEYYARMWGQGYTLGPAFRWIGPIWQGEAEALCSMENLAPVEQKMLYRLHPGLIDSCFQLFGQCYWTEQDWTAGTPEQVNIPFSVERFIFYGRPQGKLWCRVRLRQPRVEGEKSFTGDAWLFDETGRPVVKIEGFYSRAVAQSALRPASAAPTVRQWLYEMTWQAQAPSVDRNGTPGRWLILASSQTNEPAEPQAQALASFLAQHGQTCETVNTQSADFAAHLGQVLQAASPLAWRGVVYLVPSDPKSLEPLAVQETACGGFLAALKAVAGLMQENPPRIWIVTQGGQAIHAGESPDANQTALWGLGRTVAIEHPDLWGGLLDLDPHETAHEAATHLAEELLSDPTGEQVAWRGHQRLVARLAASQAKAGSGVTIRQDGTYLITGGLGGLGLQVARWLAARGARHLVLAGRRGGNEAAMQTVHTLHEDGVTVTCAQVDIANAEQVEQLFNQVIANQPPLRGVIHAAGVLDDGILLEQTWPRFQKVLAAKISGAWNLHQHTLSRMLDFFVLFSSAVSQLGSLGQGNYAAANAYLDGLAQARRSQGLPGLSINWGPWSEVGMAAQSRSIKTPGVHWLRPEDGLAALEAALNLETAQVMVFSADWETFSKSIPGSRFLLAELRQPVQPHDAQSSQTSPAAPSIAVIERLRQARAGDRQHLLAQYVHEQVASVLHFEKDTHLAHHQRLFEVGLDSLMAIELKNRLQTGLGKSLPATLVFDYPSIEALTHYLTPVLELEAASQSAPVGPSDPLAALEAKIQDLSDEEIEALLLQKLDALDNENR